LNARSQEQAGMVSNSVRKLEQLILHKKLRLENSLLGFFESIADFSEFNGDFLWDFQAKGNSSA